MWKVDSSDVGHTNLDYLGLGTFSTGLTMSGSFKATATTSYICLGEWSTGTTTNVTTFNNIEIFTTYVTDRSVKGNGLAVHGTPTVSAVATGAELKALYLNSSNDYFAKPLTTSEFDISGDWSMTYWVSGEFRLSILDVDISSQSSYSVTDFFIYKNGSGGMYYRSKSPSTNRDISGVSSYDWAQYVVHKVGTTLKTYMNGELEDTFTLGNNYSNTSNRELRLGHTSYSASYSGVSNSKVALFRISATAPTAEQIKEIYEAEKPLFQANAKCTLGTYPSDSSSVTAMAYDDSTDLLHVGTSNGRSTFKGLRRVEQTTPNTTEIAAQGGLIVEETD
jgi:hypothetical protein